MGPYTISTPFWLRMLFPPGLTWQMPREKEPVVYVTFDDGPHPTATPFVLEQLDRHNAYATFFCVGENVQRYPAIFQQIKDAGHSVGNHSFNHLNGWNTPNKTYAENIAAADALIHSKLFRPPYGKISWTQSLELHKQHPDWKVIMWSLVSADFDEALNWETCAENIIHNVQPGHIIIFHDSTRAWDRMHLALPKVLEWFSMNGWTMKALNF